MEIFLPFLFSLVQSKLNGATQIFNDLKSFLAISCQLYHYHAKLLLSERKVQFKQNIYAHAAWFTILAFKWLERILFGFALTLNCIRLFRKLRDILKTLNQIKAMHETIETIANREEKSETKKKNRQWK